MLKIDAEIGCYLQETFSLKVFSFQTSYFDLWMRFTNSPAGVKTEVEVSDVY